MDYDLQPVSGDPFSVPKQGQPPSPTVSQSLAGGQQKVLGSAKTVLKGLAQVPVDVGGVATGDLYDTQTGNRIPEEEYWPTVARSMFDLAGPELTGMSGSILKVMPEAFRGEIGKLVAGGADAADLAAHPWIRQELRKQMPDQKIQSIIDRSAGATQPGIGTGAPPAGRNVGRGGVAQTPGAAQSGGRTPLEQAEADRDQAAAGRPSLVGLPTKGITIDGKPYVPGPIGYIHDIAEKYMADKGLPYNPPTTYAPLDKPRAGRIADAFDAMPHDPSDPKTAASYDAMIKETVDQFHALKDSGIKFEFIKPGQENPYEATPRMAQQDVEQNHHLWVYPTDSGFGTETSAGSDAIKNNPLLRPTGDVIDGHPLVANDVFRIVHDVFGHLKDGNGFRGDGEENAWRSHSAMYSDAARPAMTTETRGQNSWLNYGPYGATNRTAKAADTHYADQKIGLLPDWAVNEGRGDTPTAAAPQAGAEPGGSPQQMEQGARAERKAAANARFQDAYQQGQKDYHAGVTKNPYPEGSKESMSWWDARNSLKAFYGSQKQMEGRGEAAPGSMEESERQGRALDQGFTTEAYRGATRPEASSPPVGRGINYQSWSTDDPALASRYAGGESGNPPSRVFVQGRGWQPVSGQVQPQLLNTSQYHVVDAGGQPMDKVRGPAIFDAHLRGRPGVTIKNVVDEPGEGGGAPHTVHVTFDPTTRRSKFAKFRTPGSPDAMAGIAGGSALFGSLAAGGGQGTQQ